MLVLDWLDKQHIPDYGTVQTELPIEERFHPDGYRNPGIGQGFDPLGWRGSVIYSGEVVSRGQRVITLWLSG